MTLPEIPDEVREIAHAADVIGCPHSVDDALTAAWPHLYAAALRHAAGEITPMLGDDPCGHVARLRRLADEARP